MSANTNMVINTCKTYNLSVLLTQTIFQRLIPASGGHALDGFVGGHVRKLEARQTLVGDNGIIRYVQLCQIADLC